MRHAERHGWRRRRDELSEKEDVTLIPKQLDLHEVRIIRASTRTIVGDIVSTGENICAILGVTRSSFLLGVVGQSVSLGSRQEMTAGELRCYAEESAVSGSPIFNCQQ